jgi:hypothetical protein
MLEIQVALFVFTGSESMRVLKTESFGITGQPSICELGMMLAGAV